MRLVAVVCNSFSGCVAKCVAPSPRQAAVALANTAIHGYIYIYVYTYMYTYIYMYIYIYYM